jgi:hypothetical protein
MKKQLTLYLFLIIAALSFSCGSDGEEELGPNELTADIYVDSEGDFTFTAKTNQFTAIIDGDDVVIIGNATNDFEGGGFIYLSFDLDDIEEGETYDLTGSDVEMFMVHDGSDNGISSGSITFDKVSSKRIEATFEFNTYSSYYEEDMEITDGELKATLVEGDI